MFADAVESRLKEEQIVDALDSNARGSLTAMGMSCRKSWENTEESICFEVGGSPGTGLRSKPGDAIRSECPGGRSYGFGRLKLR